MTASDAGRGRTVPEDHAPDGPLVRRIASRWSWWVAGPVLIYIVLVLAGVTQSSIGITGMRVDPAAPNGIQIGGSVGIRSDEYLTATPLAIGVTATGSAEDFNPLTAPQGFFTLLPDGPVSDVVLFDGAVLETGTVLPDQMLVAARWWLPFLLLFLGAPALFRTLTGNRWMGLFAALLIVVSPASAWWSFSPLGILGFTIAGSAALQRCAAALGERRYVHAGTWGVVCAVLLARTPLHYQPWAIVLALTIVAVTVVALVADAARRRTNLLAVGAAGVLSLLLFAGVVVENLASIRASLGTVYPGERVASGGPNSVEDLFAATSLVNLKHLPITASNPSEVSSAFTVAAVWAVLLVVAGIAFRDRGHRAATTTMLGFTGFWFTWSLVEFGPWAQHVPILNMVPTNRSTDVLGYLAILALCLVLPALARPPRLRISLLIGGVVALLAAYAGSMLRLHSIPDMLVRDIWVSSLLLGAVVAVVTYRPRWWVGYAAAVGLGTLLMWNVNPVLIGLADLRGTDVAQEMLTSGAAARDRGVVWASDDVYVDALLAATGVPALSSRQLAGPDLDAWEQLDPSRAAESVWNRGGSFIAFQWTDDDALTFTNPSPDVIHISGSPCALAERMPELTTIVASHELDLTCVTEVDAFNWNGETKRVYEVIAEG